MFLWPLGDGWHFYIPNPILHQMSRSITDKSIWGVGGQYQIPYTLLSSPMISSTTI